ncbi:Predicted dehydrogenase [Paucidesulfovibrio gracilis DSM 16080]|uniref:Predicted dehydrogenase n=1 Tax=Paucidesulfovibrio gracilis DSM 16080 TaxID=1121449 RepID=A0A1T4W9C0_9BACT|nr:Gfo/Idh/MocA family oxidoreductase [Paucidesulfovibrio gracilis]SKA73872.1 Predicted dehydrogenase [Paucidesulfovibrio gracilis DSM 16080]
MVRFALVGCGRIAQKYGTLFSNGRVRHSSLVAACEVKEERRLKFGETFRVPVFEDISSMMAAHGDAIDVVVILTESGKHAQVAFEVLEYGKHLVVEKPMALRLRDADEMVRRCDAAGVKLFVVKQNRFNLPVVKLKQALDAGRFGRITMGTVRVRWCRKQEYYDQDAWRGTWAMDGGVFANQASHHIDLLEWMLGEPVSVFAKSRTALVDVEVEDTGVAVITFAGGAIGIVEATNATRPTDLEGSISILGEKGTAEIGGFAVNEMKVWQFEEPEPDDETVLRECRTNPPDVYGFGHIEYLNNVVACLEKGSPSLVDGIEGRKSLELINAMYESIETGKEVRLKFRPVHCKLGHCREDWV